MNISKKVFILFALFLILGCAKEYSCEDCIPPEPPEVKTTQITGITISSAIFHGELTKTGKLLITDHGFCWATYPVPVITDNKISLGQTDSLQSFSRTQAGLTPNQIYYVRAFATNSIATVYGEELMFKTLNDPLKECLVAYYPFNGNTSDESGNNNHGVATGGSLSTDRNNNPARAFIFDGDDYIKVLNSSSLSSIGSSFTVTAWVFNQDPEAYIVCKSAFNGPDMQFRFYTDGGGLHFANYRKAADFSNTLTPAGTWKHIAVTCDGTIAKFYLNGGLVSTSTLHDDASVANPTTDLYIGADTHNVTEYFRGKLDEIRIYCRVLNDSDVFKIFKY